MEISFFILFHEGVKEFAKCAYFNTEEGIQTILQRTQQRIILKN